MMSATSCIESSLSQGVGGPLYSSVATWVGLAVVLADCADVEGDDGGEQAANANVKAAIAAKAKLPENFIEPCITLLRGHHCSKIRRQGLRADMKNIAVGA